MKERLHSVISILVLLMSVVLINGCKREINKNDFLKKVLSKIEQIESARYTATSGGIPPGRTVETIPSYEDTEEYFNPCDTFIGSSFQNISLERVSIWFCL